MPDAGFTNLSVVILAAGEGTRMRSSLPKVMHEIGGRSLLEHVVDTAEQLGAQQIIVVFGHGGEHVRAHLGYRNITWVEQAEQHGTGHALAQALPVVNDENQVLVLYGDVPLLSRDSLVALCDARKLPEELVLMTADLDEPRGYGRIVRDHDGSILRIVEEKDANGDERLITEINTGILTAGAAALKRWVGMLDNKNVQGEYYLTDIVALAKNEGLPVSAVQAGAKVEIMGVNDKEQLALLERHYQKNAAQSLLAAGVTLRDPQRIDVRGQLDTGQDVIIDINVIFEGSVSIGNNVRIGPHTVIRDSRIEDNVEILSHCVIDTAVIGCGSRVGPYSRIRPGTELCSDVHVGNFVEIKNSIVEQGSKINHLSYIGDTSIGRKVNIGAGTITCNYDGANKHRTTIGDDAFIGSDTQLVAPVTVGAGATIGAGSTVTRDAVPGELTLSRAPQQTVPGWKRPRKKGEPGK